MKLLKQHLTLFLCVSLVLATSSGGFAQQADQSTAPTSTDLSSTTPTPVQSAQETPEQLQQLVAPIALYPDALVAQILAASTYPAQVVEADRWMQQHSNLKGDQLAQEVNKQNWDPSVKALAQFPTVLANLDKNITWTSGLGDAYTNQPQDVMNAVQVMRQRAQQSGNLKITPQENVTTQGQTIVIQPANPQVVYVPEYDPWVVYGYPVVAYPGWYSYPGLYIAEPGIAFGLGFGVGFFSGFGWGFHNWGFDWRDRRVLFNHNTFISHSRTFVNRGDFGRGREGFNRGGEFRGGGFNHAQGFRGGGEFHGGAPVSHGFAEPHGGTGVHSGAFSGFNHGGVARGFSAHGASSFHGGGGHGGGGHR
ncbi:MAG: hypothetical protein JWO20_1595 [Candidatus Angelobacter sp.]|nr:hypothetical protein [Candidatus Angelobacter sp.]